MVRNGIRQTETWDRRRRERKGDLRALPEVSDIHIYLTTHLARAALLQLADQSPNWQNSQTG
jgi:hypothetical protein